MLDSVCGMNDFTAPAQECFTKAFILLIYIILLYRLNAVYTVSGLTSYGLAGAMLPSGGDHLPGVKGTPCSRGWEGTQQ